MSWQKDDGRPPIGAKVEITAGKSTKCLIGTVSRYTGTRSIEVRTSGPVVVVAHGEYKIVKVRS